MPADRWAAFLVAALLVTSFTFTGWVALWATHARVNWFVHTVVLLIFIAPLLAAGAYEVFAAFIIQALLIALFIQFGRWYVRRQQLKAPPSTNPESAPPPPMSFRFSMLSMLQITFLVAAGSWIALRLPKLNSLAWVNVAYIAGAAALATMGGPLLALSRKPAAWIQVIGFSLLCGAGLAWFDWFVPSLTSSFSSWPPDPTSGMAGLGIGVPDRPLVVWFFIPLTIALLTALFVSLQVRAFPPTQPPTEETSQPNPTNLTRSRRRTQLALATLTLFVAAFPFFMLARLLILDPIPATSLPNPNGHDDLVAAGKIASATAFGGGNNFDYETASQQALAAEVGKCGTAYDLIAQGIARECRAPIDYSSSPAELPMPDIIAARATARALAGKARLDELKGEFDDSARANVQAIQFGNNFRQGGLLVDALVGIACSGHGTEPLYKKRSKLSPAQLDDCIAQLTRLDASDEPYADVWLRDRVWVQRGYGWHGHLLQILDDLTDHSYTQLFTADEATSMSTGPLRPGYGC